MPKTDTGIGVDTRMSQGERETKDQLERDC